MSVHGRRSHQPRGRRACGRRLPDVSVGGTRRPGLRGRGRYRQDDVVVDGRRSSTRTRLRGVVGTGGFGGVGAGIRRPRGSAASKSTSRRGRTYPSRNVSLSIESCCGAPKPIPRRISGLLPPASWLSSGESRQGPLWSLRSTICSGLTPRVCKWWASRHAGFQAGSECWQRCGSVPTSRRTRRGSRCPGPNRSVESGCRH